MPPPKTSFDSISKPPHGTLHLPLKCVACQLQKPFSIQFRHCRMARFQLPKSVSIASRNCRMASFSSIPEMSRCSFSALPRPKTPCPQTCFSSIPKLPHGTFHIVSPTPEMSRCSFSALPGQQSQKASPFNRGSVAPGR